MSHVIPLWDIQAPYTAQSPEQAQPSVEAFEAEGARVAVIVCPGGAYYAKTAYEGAPVAQMFCDNGISGFVLDYRVSPCHPMAPLADAQRAIRLVRSMGYQWVGILGFSAGGHLTCSAATHYDAGNPQAQDPLERISCRPDFFIPCYALVSFTQYTHMECCMTLLGKPDQRALERYFSAELNVTPDTPPAFIWHSFTDSAVPVENALLLASALARAGVMFQLQVYPTGKHGVGLGANRPLVQNWPAQCVEFIRFLTQSP